MPWDDPAEMGFGIKDAMLGGHTERPGHPLTLRGFSAATMRWPLHGVFGFVVCFCFQMAHFDMSTKTLPRSLCSVCPEGRAGEAEESRRSRIRDGGQAGVEALAVLRGRQNLPTPVLAMNAEQKLRNAVPSLLQTCWMALLLRKQH